MESSEEPLSIESFSHSWLTSVKSPLDGLEESFRPSLETTSQELDYRIVKKTYLGDFNFDVPIHHPFAHADQLFSDGIIKPVYINKSKIETSESLDLAPTVSSSVSFRVLVPTVDVQCHVLRRWRKSVEQILQKCCGYLRPWCHKIIGSSKSRRVGDIDRRGKHVSSSRSTPQSSPINDFEHSIYEAILHCKR
ncbi:probable membrane-associated kinase regulator 6 [Euphorbia lathyris]|uniref:probable membrane-associated kinase regulator 6 n=1 Tax=Euphorbia lathyris TaxID=212925 RepID=UPI00331436D4